MAEQIVETDGPVESHEIPSQLNYKFKNYSGPKYKFSRVVPLSGSQVVDLPISSTAEVLMEIPTNVFNFAESYLYADIAIAPQGIGIIFGTIATVCHSFPRSIYIQDLVFTFVSFRTSKII
jgi:hypothetical protein